jgi:hypothetical protein
MSRHQWGLGFGFGPGLDQWIAIKPMVPVDPGSVAHRAGEHRSMYMIIRRALADGTGEEPVDREERLQARHVDPGGGLADQLDLGADVGQLKLDGADRDAMVPRDLFKRPAHGRAVEPPGRTHHPQIHRMSTPKRRRQSRDQRDVIE